MLTRSFESVCKFPFASHILDVINAENNIVSGLDLSALTLLLSVYHFVEEPFSLIWCTSNTSSTYIKSAQSTYDNV